jgi:hypothetical protein
MSDGGREMVFDSVPDIFANMKTILMASLILTVAAQAAAPDFYRKLWRDPAVNERIERNIEKVEGTFRLQRDAKNEIIV